MISSPTSNVAMSSKSAQDREKIKRKIINDRQPLENDFVDILKEKSCVAGVKQNSEKDEFSTFIRQAYIDIQKGCSISKIIMKIVANIRDIKIIFLPNEKNILKYELDEEPEFCLEGITYPKSETIIIAARSYSVETEYKQFLGKIIHELCHFAIEEIFGNKMKPYFKDDVEIAAKWDHIVDSYKSNEFPLFEQIFENYPETKWINELVVRYPQFCVENSGSIELENFEKHFYELSELYNCNEQFESEILKTTSLRLVNEKSMLSMPKPFFDIYILEYLIDINSQLPRQIVRANQTFLAMKNIFDTHMRSFDLKSTFMFVDIEFLIDDEQFNLLEMALKCKKYTHLVIDAHSIVYEKQSVMQKLESLFDSKHPGKITLILHESQKFGKNEDVEIMKFVADDLNEKFKKTLKVNFQNCTLTLWNLMESMDTIEVLTEMILNRKDCKNLMLNEIPVGNIEIGDLPKYYVEREFQMKTMNGWNDVDLNDYDCLIEIFETNSFIVVVNESGEGKSTESLRMYQRIKSAYPNNWVVHVNLSAYAEVFALKKADESTVEHFASKILKIESVEKEIFKMLLECGRVILIFDSLDEVYPDLTETIENLIKYLGKNNKICMFTRRFALKALKDIEFAEIKIVKMSVDMKKDLISLILLSKNIPGELNYESLLEKTYNFLQLYDSDNPETADSDAEKDYEMSLEKAADNDFSTPLLTKIVTEVFRCFPVRMDRKITKFDLYNKFVSNLITEIDEKESAYVYLDNMKCHEFNKIFWKISLEHYLSLDKGFSWISDMDRANLRSARRDLDEFYDEFFYEITLDESNIIPLLRTGIIIRNYGSNSVRFVHASFRLFFIAQFVRNNCSHIFRNERNLNIFCLIANNMEDSALGCLGLMMHLKENQQVKVGLSKIGVFKDMMNGDRPRDEDEVRLGPIMTELYKNEKTFRQKFITRYKDPTLKNVNLERVSLTTFAQCDDVSGFFHVSFDVFKEMFMRNKFFDKKINQMSCKESSLFFDDLTSSMKIIAKHRNLKMIKLFLKLHEHYLSFDEYIDQDYVNDFLVELISSDALDFESLEILKAIVVKFCTCKKLNIFDFLRSHESFQWFGSPYFKSNPLKAMMLSYVKHPTMSAIEFLNSDLCNMPLASISVLAYIVGSENAFIRLLYAGPILYIIEKISNELDSPIIYTFFNLVSDNLKPEYVRKILLKSYSKISCFNILQHALLNQCKHHHYIIEDTPEKMINLFYGNEHSKEVLREAVANNNFIKEFGKVFVDEFSENSKLVRVLELLSFDDFPKLLYHTGWNFKSIEVFEGLIKMIRKLTGDENFVKLMLSYDPPLKSFIRNAKTAEHCDTLISVLTSCESFRDYEKNFHKLFCLLKMNVNLSDEDIYRFIESYNIEY